ncbi:unnamed protein product [Psylliodes chrysocephalus]|uniref:Uncharacterized protein n=1 Tax=Psylliodes chrysocephalus TaxID=3402493 RepID=A0A9P0GA92_9CUCU|nr:unnamed protein product [Psylliodes chrysocephala]
MVLKNAPMWKKKIYEEVNESDEIVDKEPMQNVNNIRDEDGDVHEDFEDLVESLRVILLVSEINKCTKTISTNMLTKVRVPSGYNFGFLYTPLNNCIDVVIVVHQFMMMF